MTPPKLLLAMVLGSLACFPQSPSAFFGAEGDGMVASLVKDGHNSKVFMAKGFLKKSGFDLGALSGLPSENEEEPQNLEGVPAKDRAAYRKAVGSELRRMLESLSDGGIRGDKAELSPYRLECNLLLSASRIVKDRKGLGAQKNGRPECELILEGRILEKSSGKQVAGFVFRTLGVEVSRIGFQLGMDRPIQGHSMAMRSHFTESSSFDPFGSLYVAVWYLGEFLGRNFSK